MKIEVRAINTEDINVDVLQAIAKEIFKGEPKERQAEQINETLHKSPSLEEMKFDLDVYQKIAKTLSNKIKEEENRRKKETHHLIEKKVRTTTIDDKMIFTSEINGFKSNAKRITSEEVIKYVREGNKIICTIETSLGKFKGIATQHTDDEFRYDAGMQLAMFRARRNMYTELESSLTSQL